MTNGTNSFTAAGLSGAALAGRTISCRDGMEVRAYAYGSSIVASLDGVYQMWAGWTDDANGIGVYEVSIVRNGTWLTTGPYETEFVDTTVAASTTYTYQIYPRDLHGSPFRNRPIERPDMVL